MQVLNLLIENSSWHMINVQRWQTVIICLGSYINYLVALGKFFNFNLFWGKSFIHLVS